MPLDLHTHRHTAITNVCLYCSKRLWLLHSTWLCCDPFLPLSHEDKICQLADILPPRGWLVKTDHNRLLQIYVCIHIHALQRKCRLRDLGPVQPKTGRVKARATHSHSSDTRSSKTPAGIVVIWLLPKSLHKQRQGEVSAHIVLRLCYWG